MRESQGLPHAREPDWSLWWESWGRVGCGLPSLVWSWLRPGVSAHLGILLDSGILLLKKKKKAQIKKALACHRYKVQIWTYFLAQRSWFNVHYWEKSVILFYEKKKKNPITLDSVTLENHWILPSFDSYLPNGDPLGWAPSAWQGSLPGMPRHAPGWVKEGQCLRVPHHLSEAAAQTPLLCTECSPPEAGAWLPRWKQNHVQYVSPTCGLG